MTSEWGEDGIILSIVGYSIILLSLRWNQFQACRNPLHIFLMGDYVFILLFRLSKPLQMCCGARSLLSKRVLLLLKVCVLYLFFIGWTMVGSVWFSEDEECMTERNLYWTMVAWLILSYVWIIVYGILLALEYTCSLGYRLPVRNGARLGCWRTGD